MIRINERNLEFHLQTENTSYIFKVLESKHLSNLYYGRRIKHRENYDSLYQNLNIDLGNSTNYTDKQSSFTLDSTKLELSTYGKGDYREPSIKLEFEDGSRVSDFHYVTHRVINGKPLIEGLPHTYGDKDVITLEVKLYDDVKDISIYLYYSVFYSWDVITRSMKVVNGNKSKVNLERIMSFNLDFSDSDYQLLTLEGKWIRERHINLRKINKGVFYIDSKKGVSSSNHNPFLCLKREYTNEQIGECYGFSLVYSGNHQGLVEVNPHNLTRIQMGINPFDFNWMLDKEESFNTPEVVMTFSHEGLNKMSQNFHNIINNNLIPKQWQGKERPILINNWEATYFDFNEKKLLKLAKTAKDLGIELFVLDDGWFGKRDDDTTSLGDWFENTKKIPSGLEGLAKKINDIGLDFGIWVEPEMISVDSQLYRNHPDWAIKLNDREPSFGRNQLILDLSNPDVVEYLYQSLSNIIKKANIKYIKWDMNRNFSDIYSNYLPKDRQKELGHRYVLGLYSLLQRLTNEFEDVLFESCASGGNRFDMGMLYYMPQTWTSDNTDAVERLSIQYGTSLVYPPSTMGAHVSGAPNHQVLRTTPIETRFNVAAFGLLGYELDVNKLSNFDKKVIKNQINFYKEYRHLLQYGAYFRLQSPFESNHCIWMVVSQDKNEALLGYYQKLQESNKGFESIELKGLDEDKMYHLTTRLQYLNIKQFGELINDFIPINIKEDGMVHNLISDNYMFELEKQEVTAYGDELMYAGFKPYNQFIGTGYNNKIRYIGDFGSRIYYIKA